jgi:bifunctional non-homologous end joining protein LigD
MGLPRFEPMPLARLHAPFDHQDWIFELKYDGFRALAHVEAGQCRLMSRNRNAFRTFPSLAAGIAAALSREAVIDGEIVHFDVEGRPQFYDLMRRRGLQHFCAFDLLWLDGRDLRGLPLLERKRLLHGLVPRQTSPLLYVDHFTRQGVELFQAVCERDLEGIVAKLAAGVYEPAATTWVKIKNAAYSQAEGRADFFDRKAARAGRVDDLPLNGRQGEKARNHHQRESLIAHQKVARTPRGVQ